MPVNIVEYNGGEISQMNSARLSDLAERVLEYMALNGSCTGSITIGSSNPIGTFSDTVRGGGVGSANTTILSTTYTLSQVNSTTLTVQNPPYYVGLDSTNSSELILQENLTTLNDIADYILNYAVTVGPFCYYLGTSAPVDGGTWTSLGTLADTLEGFTVTVNTYHLWKKLSNGSYDAVRPMKILNGELTQYTEDEILSLAKIVEQRIVSTGIGTYALQTSTPGTGTWSTAGTITDVRRTTSDVNYDSIIYYTGIAPASYGGFTPASYEGFAPTSYEGFTPASYEGVTPASYEGFAPTSYEGVTPASYEGFTPASYEGFTPASYTSSTSFSGFSPVSFGGVVYLDYLGPGIVNYLGPGTVTYTGSVPQDFYGPGGFTNYLGPSSPTGFAGPPFNPDALGFSGAPIFYVPDQVNYFGPSSVAYLGAQGVSTTYLGPGASYYVGTIPDSVNFAGPSPAAYTGTVPGYFDGTTPNSQYFSSTVPDSQYFYTPVPTNYDGITPANYDGIFNYDGITPFNYDGITPSNYDGLGPLNYDGLGPLNYDGITPSNYDGITPSNYDGIGPLNYDGITPANYDGITSAEFAGVIPAYYTGQIVSSVTETITTITLYKRIG